MSKAGHIPPTSFRIPPELKQALAKRAEANRRSSSQELIAALEYYLATAPPRFAHLAIEPTQRKPYKSK